MEVLEKPRGPQTRIGIPAADGPHFEQPPLEARNSDRTSSPSNVEHIEADRSFPLETGVIAAADDEPSMQLQRLFNPD